MKKIGLIVMFLLLCGCTSQSKESKQFDKYDQIKNELVHRENFDEVFPFRVSVVYNELEGNYRYDVIINEPTEEMYNIVALAYANESDQKMCPAIGIFDEETYNLKENFIDKRNGFYKGVQLSGVTSTKQKVKLYVEYFTDKEKTNKAEYYIEVK